MMLLLCHVSAGYFFGLLCYSQSVITSGKTNTPITYLDYVTDNRHLYFRIYIPKWWCLNWKRWRRDWTINRPPSKRSVKTAKQRGPQPRKKSRKCPHLSPEDMPGTLGLMCCRRKTWVALLAWDKNMSYSLYIYIYIIYIYICIDIHFNIYNIADGIIIAYAVATCEKIETTIPNMNNEFMKSSQ